MKRLLVALVFGLLACSMMTHAGAQALSPTASGIELAACQRYDGSWACAGIPQPSAPLSAASATAVLTPTVVAVSLVTVLSGYLTQSVQTGGLFGLAAPPTLIPWLSLLASFLTVFLTSLLGSSMTGPAAWFNAVMAGLVGLGTHNIGVTIHQHTSAQPDGSPSARAGVVKAVAAAGAIILFALSVGRAQAAGGPQPVFPSAWKVPAWFIDPANVSGNANDTNSCTTSAAPCATWGQINTQRWGCFGNPTLCPRLQQTTTINFMSSQSTASDLVAFNPSMENGVVSIQCPLGAAQQVASGTIAAGGFVARNVALVAGTLMHANTGATAVNQLVVNTQAGKSSRAWTYTNIAGAVYSMTQAQAPYAVTTGGCGAEVNTWAIGDSVTVYAPITVYFSQLWPKWAGGDAELHIVNCGTPPSGTFRQMNVNTSVDLIESLVQEELVQNSSDVGFSRLSANSILAGGVTNVGAGGPPYFCGGEFLQNVSMSFANMQNDVIYTGGTQFDNLTTGSIYVESGASLECNKTFTASSGTIWGGGDVYMTGPGRMVYRSGAGGAVATFLQTGTIQLNNLYVGCLGVPTAASAFAPCNLATTPAVLDANLGAVTGCLASPGGASVCNFAP